VREGEVFRASRIDDFDGNAVVRRKDAASARERSQPSPQGSDARGLVIV
jgi:hypothetical protein